MSLTSAIARVGELESLLAAVAAGGPGVVVPPEQSGFDRRLAEAAAPSAASAGAGETSPASRAGGSSGPVDGRFADEINAAAARHRLDPALLKALIRQESNFNPNAVSPAGAKGLTQLMPGTAAALGVKNPLDPAQAINGGAKYLRQQLDRFGGDVRKALAAYNAGPGAVARHGGVPPYAETQNYVRKVMAYAEEYRRAAAAPAGARIA